MRLVSAQEFADACAAQPVQMKRVCTKPFTCEFKTLLGFKPVGFWVESSEGDQLVRNYFLYSPEEFVWNFKKRK